MRFCKLLYLLAVTASFASCYSELGGDLPPIASEGQSLSISFESDRMLPQTVTTRISDPKTEEEKKINTLHIFFFGPGGEYLEGKYLEGYPQAGEQGGYCAPSQGATILKIDRSEGAFDKADSAKAATIVAVANVEEFTFPLEDGTRRPSNIKRLGDLEKFLYKPKNGVALGLPEEGMPMFGISRGNDLTTTTTNALTIEMKALMARIDLNVKLDSEEGSTGGLPRMQLVEWSVKNLPVQMPFVQDADGALGENKKTIKSTSSQQITNRNGEMNLSFYMFENLQEKKTDDYDYPDSVKVDEYQRYKPLIADTANATCVQLHTFYTTYNNYLYDATYTLYLGANHTDDFKVYRNRQYKNNITVKGITKVGNNPDHITLDARVNVTTDNPFFISILRERNHDAHFCITPMDVYMFEDKGEDDLVKMEVSIDAPDDHTWIRMEKVTAAQMEAGEAPNDKCLALGQDNPFHAGNGKRRYFTTNLLTDVNELKNNTTMTLETHRDRIYFYIDENLKLEDRSVNIHFKYTGPDGSVKERDMLISQTHLLPVTIEEYYEPELLDGVWLGQGGRRTVTIYMEVVEEYLEHYDPLNEFGENVQIYSGLPWGNNGYIGNKTGIINLKYELTTEGMRLQWDWNDNWYDDCKATFETSHNWYQGLLVTNRIINDFGQGEMNLNEQPESAAEYCYNRNKRNSDGSVADGNKKWFLPGIRQMERSLTKYYNQFPEFQGNFYWSSAAGEVENGSSGQSSVRARATKVNADGSYVNSGGGDGEGEECYAYEKGKGGYALRTEKLRIRAFRNDLVPIE